MFADNKCLRKDIIYFNLIMVLVLAVVSITLLSAPVIGSLNMFILVAGLIFNLILAYNLGLQRGLIVAIILTLAYGSCIIYETTITKKIAEVSFAYIAWLVFYPLSSLLAGQLAMIVSSYKKAVEAKEVLEKLVTIDASTDFYNHQGFFRKLDEEFLRSKRYKTYFSIILIKLVDLEELELIYGKQQLIKIMQAVANKVTAQTRCSDIKAMVEENLLSIMLPETNEDGAKVVIEKLHRALDSISTDIRGSRKVIRVKPNFGIASIRECDTDVLEIYARAKEEINYDRG